MEKIKVFYDYQIMLGQKYGGISRYFYELLTHINESESVHADAFSVGNINMYFKDYFNKASDKTMRGMGYINRFFASHKMKKYDIIHPTYYHPYVLKCKNKKIVVTVYDMIHEIFPNMVSQSDVTAENKKKMIYGADHIIAISQSTKNDILKFYPDIPPEKISVIYIASNMTPLSEKKQIDLPRDFILFVGNRGAYKNFNAFMRSVKPILSDNPDLYLVCLGGGAFSDEERELMGDVQDRVIQKNAFDAELAYAYSKALCFVFPTLYEGFGIPTLEAFACDCPAVISNTSSMPEVGGDAAVYFNPSDESDMRNKIRQVVEDKDLRNHMIEKGRERLSKFDWRTIAEETIECYKNVLNQGSNQ